MPLKQLPYKGYIEVEVSFPLLGNNTSVIPVLVVTNTEYNNTVSSIIGRNVIRLCTQSNPTTDIPAEWQTAFGSMCDITLPVKTTNSDCLKTGHREIKKKTLHGSVRKEGDMDAAVTEHIDSSLSGNLTIWSRFVSLKSPVTTVRVPVRVCKISTRVIEIPPESLLCSSSSITAVDSWTPDSSQKKAESTTTSSLEDMAVKIDTSNLTPGQISRTREVLCNWSSIFFTSPTDLDRADIVKHEIKLSDDTPFKDPYRRIPPALYEDVRQHLKDMLDADAIRPSKSPYSSNAVLVRKKDGALRFCIDFRKLNSRIIKDTHTLPRIVDTRDTLIGAKHFSIYRFIGKWK